MGPSNDPGNSGHPLEGASDWPASQPDRANVEVDAGDDTKAAAEANTAFSTEAPAPARIALRRPVKSLGADALDKTAAARRRALAELQELYVDDAGLVMLWPFIERGFLRAGLMPERERRFMSAEAQQQGVLMLSWLALEDPAPPEFILPLAKLLCGLSPEAPCASEPPLAPACMDEGRRLLAATIGHAPLLQPMTVPAFRAAFLRRRGVLSVRAGSWLLQVERQEQEQDRPLDHLPWSWTWLRLPWMPDALQVEW
jgi:hypothetical protein